jgi:hypothetical protein
MCYWTHSSVLVGVMFQVLSVKLHQYLTALHSLSPPPPPPHTRTSFSLFLLSRRNIEFGANLFPAFLWTTCGIPRRSIWVVEQFWCLYTLQGQSNMFFCCGDQANLYNHEVDTNPGKSRDACKSVPCLLFEGFKSEFCYMCRTDKSADLHCTCQSLT